MVNHRFDLCLTHSSHFCLCRIQPRVRQQRIDSAVDFFSSVSLRLGTKMTYNTHHNTFIRLCAQININPLLPLTERQLCHILVLYMETGHRITTLPNFISAVANWASSHGHPPLPRDQQFQQCKQGLLNWYGDDNFAQKKEALTIDDLRTIKGHLNLSLFKDARDFCAGLFAFFGLLRINEYSNGSLLVRDVVITATSICLTIQHSKTQLTPVKVELVRRDDALCPVAAHNTYTTLIPAHLRSPSHPFFLSSPNSSAPMKGSAFIHRLKSFIRTVLLRDPTSFSGHSFRRGGASALHLAGVPEATIASHGRWSSLTYRQYFDTQHSQQLRLAATTLLKDHSLTSLHPSLNSNRSSSYRSSSSSSSSSNLSSGSSSSSSSSSLSPYNQHRYRQ
jgi:integrase